MDYYRGGILVMNKYVESVIEKEIDYKKINKFIEDEREKTRLYLAGNLR